MKTCNVCGRENEDTAVYCVQCGAGEFRDADASSSLNAEVTLESPPPGPPDEWVTVFLPTYPTQAAIVSGRLKASGIECIVVNQTPDVGGPWLPAVQTFLDVKVRRKDFRAAKGLLASIHAEAS